MASSTSLSLLLLCASATWIAAQTPPAESAPPPANPTPAAAPAILPSATMQPSLNVLRTALGDVRIERWRASNAIRGEAQSNVDSIQRDVQSTLPSLLATADAAPDSTAKMLPLYRNIDALYDVLLRVDAAARLAAPNEQMSEIDQALSQLEDGRRALGDRLQQTSEAQERQVIHLQAALKAVPPPQPPPPPPPAPAPVKCPATPVRRRRPAAKPKPPTPPANSQNSATTSH